MFLVALMGVQQLQIAVFGAVLIAVLVVANYMPPRA